LDKELTLDFRRTSGELVRFEFTGIKETNICGLWNGAILSNFFIWKASQVPESTWLIPDCGWNALFRNRFADNDARVATAEIASRNPEPFLVVAEYSYGGQLAAVFELIKIFDGVYP
jgi:hypothetical protein